MTIRDRLAKLPTPAVSDAQASMGVLHPDIITRTPGVIGVGRAFTVNAYPGSILTVHKALMEAKPGDFLVVDGEADPAGALFGGIMARRALKLGLAGIVVDGPVRDVNDLQTLGFPVFSRYVTPRVGSNRRVGKTQGIVSCGGVVVAPGDWVLADDDGVVVIPAEEVEDVVRAAEEVLANEEKTLARIEAGEHISPKMRELIYGSST